MRRVLIHDTLSGERRELEPRKPGRVGIYACGPTVYGRIHIGNARPYVIFTLLKRFLQHEGLEAKLVINVTDINDKIYDAAREEAVPSSEWAERMTAAYRDDTDALGLGRPDAEPLATETISEIVALIESLIESGHAYRANGDVYFRVRSFADYGRLSNRDPAEMDQGEEAGTESLKEDPLDFALWKGRKEGEDTSWPSPWGDGRPGWHIECSAMAEAELGPDFAVHGGGSDLVFPHHENEIAQSQGAGRPFARIWMHNGMVELDREKMSKSEGNIFQLSEAIERFGGQTVVAYLAAGHYRQPIAFSEEILEEAAARLEGIRNYLRDAPAGDEADPFLAAKREQFLDALADDFNTPRAFAALAEIVAEGNRRELAGAHGVLAELLPLLGLDSLLASEEEADPEAQAKLAEREEARAAKDFDRADAIRDELAEMGWEVRDGAGGARLVRRR